MELGFKGGQGLDRRHQPLHDHQVAGPAGGRRRVSPGTSTSRRPRQRRGPEVRRDVREALRRGARRHPVANYAAFDVFTQPCRTGSVDTHKVLPFSQGAVPDVWGPLALGGKGNVRHRPQFLYPLVISESGGQGVDIAQVLPAAG